jgi:pimeloyl-ACP methyl ester carboxylesterase
MPSFQRGDATIHYDIHGEGFPVLALAPGGMRSSAPYWERVSWNPAAELAPDYRVILMDQRNAGRSTAPVTARDGWADYTADQIALLDHLEIDRCHLAGMCIGGPYIMGLAEAAPERLAGAVMLQPIGLDGNRQAFHDMFDDWADEKKAGHPEATADDWAAFRANMFDGEFLFNVDEGFVAGCPLPLLVMMGSDVYHPEATSRRVAELAPNATLVERWKEPPDQAPAHAAIRRFLDENR